MQPGDSRSVGLLIDDVAILLSRYPGCRYDNSLGSRVYLRCLPHLRGGEKKKLKRKKKDNDKEKTNEDKNKEDKKEKEKESAR